MCRPPAFQLFQLPGLHASGKTGRSCGLSPEMAGSAVLRSVTSRLSSHAEVERSGDDLRFGTESALTWQALQARQASCFTRAQSVSPASQDCGVKDQ